jgi:hypothetical protein
LTEEGHAQAAGELRATRGRLLLPDDIRAYAELTFGVAFQLLAVGCQRQFGRHRDNHEGLARWLREQGEEEASGLWQELERARVGHWYGRHGNGDAAAWLDQLLERISAWAMAAGGQ